MDWELDCFDAKRAFLHGKIKEEVYMRQPRGFEQRDASGAQLVCQLISSIYGLKQAAFNWYDLLRTVLSGMGFTRCEADHAVFTFFFYITPRTLPARRHFPPGCEIERRCLSIHLQHTCLRFMYYSYLSPPIPVLLILGDSIPESTCSAQYSLSRYANLSI
jgi:hypothetical protein